MSASGTLALAIQEEERWVGEMNEQQERDFILRYSKGHYALRGPSEDLTLEREQHEHEVGCFLQDLQQRFKP